MVAPYAPSSGMRLMGAMLNPTMENASFPPALLDWGAVIPGRCSAAWQRDKLEFQERLFDEVAVSMFWLWGANWMDKLFSQIQKAIPALKHVKTDVGMGIYNGQSLIRNGLTPLERFSRHHGQAMTMQSVRSGKTLLSIITNFLIIALLIPRINQWKTAWLVKKFYKPTQQPPTSPDLRLGSQAALSQQATHAQAAFNYLNQSVKPAGKTRFGSAEGVLKALEVVKSTDYGYILTGDGAMLAGRSYSAFTRPDVSRKDTVGEVREILWRDAVSSYLYLWGIPHITRLVSHIIKPFWHSETRLEPMVGQMVLHQLTPLLNQIKGPVTRPALNQWWKGHAVPQSVHNQWFSALSDVHQPDRFWGELAQDVRHTMGDDAWRKVEPALRASAPFKLSAADMGTWLSHIRHKLPNSADIIRSVKRAYGQSVGMPLKDAYDTLLPMLPKAQQAAAAKRLQLHAINQTRRQLADVWRFATVQAGNNWSLKQLSAAHGNMSETIQALADWLDKQALVFSDKAVFDPAFQQLPQLLEALAQRETQPLFRHLAEQARASLANPVLRHVEADMSGVANPVTHMLTGAARHNPQLVQEAMRLVGVLPEDLRQEVHPGKYRQLLDNMDTFWHHLMQYLPDEALANGKLTEDALKRLAKTHNMLPRYVSLAAGILGAMVSLGILVPKIQYWITKKTTGKNEQPALAALRQRYGIAKS